MKYLGFNAILKTPDPIVSLEYSQIRPNLNLSIELGPSNSVPQNGKLKKKVLIDILLKKEI